MLAAALVAFAVTLAVCPTVVRALRRFGVLDRPCGRSSHEDPTPRGAGLAVAVGAISAVSFAPPGSPWAIALVVVPAGFGLLGLVEDIRGVPALWRLLMQAVIAAAALPLLVSDLSGPGAWLLVFTCGVLLWLVAYVNAFNFMDGINGIAVMQAVIAGAVWWAIGSAEAVPGLAWGGAIIVGAAAGFAPFNFPRAKAFLGDTGSYFLGAWLAVLVVVGLRAGLPPEAVLAPLGVALADTLWALVGRVRRGERWHEPHKQHVYQRLVSAGWSQPATTLFVAGIVLACSGLGAWTLTTTVPARIVADVAIGALLVGYLLSPGVAVVALGSRAAATQQL